MTFGISGSRTQSIRSSKTDTPHIERVVPFTNSGEASLGLSYQVSPRTSMAVSAASSRSFSSGQDAYANTLRLTLGRMMGRRWFVTGHGGAAMVVPIRSPQPRPMRPDWIAGGSIGARAASHSVMLDVNRTFGDGFGVGAYESRTASAVWQWGRMRSRWSLYAMYSVHEVLGGSVRTAWGWRGNVGFGRVLGAGFVATTDLGYMNYYGTVIGSKYRLELQAVRVSLNWVPGIDRRSN
jgi:hypothetical protein